MYQNTYPTDGIKRIKFFREATTLGLKEAKEIMEEASFNLKKAFSIASKKYPYLAFDHDVKKKQDYAQFYFELTGKKLEKPISNYSYMRDVNNSIFVLTVNGEPQCFSENTFTLIKKAEKFQHNKKTKIKIIKVNRAK